LTEKMSSMSKRKRLNQRGLKKMNAVKKEKKGVKKEILEVGGERSPERCTPSVPKGGKGTRLKRQDLITTQKESPLRVGGKGHTFPTGNAFARKGNRTKGEGEAKKDQGGVKSWEKKRREPKRKKRKIN